ncbi:MAG: NAD(P)/FAD-dependent oxidoreductase [Caldilineaceae bacterium]|nr:NAD(P)/FAD-dependent oxidoreductase [Caldilineaceae bacterium]
MPKTILIIGGGLAGLAAGCYAQMNGYQSEIFERHHLPGGLCTAWERRGYVFDGCLQYLFGSGSGQPYHQLWQELGAVQARPMINHTELIRVRDPHGDTLTVHCDPDRLAAHMKEISPTDARVIDELCDGIRRFQSFDLSLMQRKPKSLMTPHDWANMGRAMLPYVAPLARWGMISARDFARRCKDPFFRMAIPHMFGWPDIPMLVGMSLLAYMQNGNAGFPSGGSLAFARAIEQRYLALGGRIHYRAMVERILVEDAPGGGRKAVGVRLYSDEEHRADYVVSAADGRATIFDMLGGEFAGRALRRRYAGQLPLHTQVQISLGVNRDLSAEPHWVTYLLRQPITIAGEDRHELSVKHYSFDPTLAPPGKAVLAAILTTQYRFWQRIYGNKLYDTEQDQVSGIIIEHLEKLFPGLRNQIEVIDEATPLSYERYTGNWQGSSCGWLLTKQTMPMMVLGMAKTLPGLRNFYMAGQWVEPGGSAPIVAMSGRNVVQLICHADGRPFITTTPQAATVTASSAPVEREAVSL